ncbi:uncharacterized protein LOC114828222 [Galendromus occidentalis]|uniref:Uncharacterized protein LOC114828222 n=1 Tax=Galendromus occidentalis TaxID=34638 RepID=A0AAJ7WHH5_9ACAR|nr:uncharacterized protein LOC114828222 [Galendromus occidentalis]
MPLAFGGSPTNETIIPYYFCDLQREAPRSIYECSLPLLPEQPRELVQRKVKELIKDASITDFVAEVCKTAPKLFSNTVSSEWRMRMMRIRKPWKHKRCRRAAPIMCNSVLLRSSGWCQPLWRFVASKEFQAVTKTVLITCWNATAYWIPIASQTRYMDIGLYFG